MGYLPLYETYGLLSSAFQTRTEKLFLGSLTDRNLFVLLL